MAELAVCLPVILAIVLGTIGTSSYVFTRQAMCTGAYEGVRVAIRQDATTEKAKRRCEEVLAARGIQGATVSFSPANVKKVKRGQWVTVTINATSVGASYLPSSFHSGPSLTVQAAMVKE